MKKKKKKLYPIAFLFTLALSKKKKILEGQFLCGLALTKLIT